MIQVIALGPAVIILTEENVKCYSTYSVIYFDFVSTVENTQGDFYTTNVHVLVKHKQKSAVALALYILYE